ncbi:MAG TPA: hypothetical protein PK594_06895, partial [Mycobacterium sp.]|nr:hypothetical protein [Mycobacterium sp.]
MSGRLAGRAAIVTGASRGLGRATALALAAEGAAGRLDRMCSASSAVSEEGAAPRRTASSRRNWAYAA